MTAEGGGDYPEALDEALAEALAKPSWLSPDSTVQLVFLVADAPPQISRNVQTPYDDSMIAAAERGIKILPISSSGTDDQAEYVFRQLAQFTGGRYVFLTYGAAGKATGTSTDITERGYEELSLDDLIVRTISEELEALTTASTAATASAATTTIPEPPTTTTPTTLQTGYCRQQRIAPSGRSGTSSPQGAHRHAYALTGHRVAQYPQAPVHTKGDWLLCLKDNRRGCGCARPVWKSSMEAGRSILISKYACKRCISSFCPFRDISLQ